MWERGERRSTFGLNEHGTEVELRAQGSRPRTQKHIRGQRHNNISSFEDRPFLGQGHRCKCSQKQIIIIIIRSSKFFSGVLKKQNQKISKKTSFSTKSDQQNFKDS